MTLVLLPGMMCDGRLFQHMPTHLCFAISHHDTVQALAADVLLKAPKCFALGGLSMGGIVAMEVIRQAPNRVTRLCADGHELRSGNRPNQGAAPTPN